MVSGKLGLNGGIEIGWDEKLLQQGKYTYLIDRISLKNKKPLPAKVIVIESILERAGLHLLAVA